MYLTHVYYVSSSRGVNFVIELVYIKYSFQFDHEIYEIQKMQPPRPPQKKHHTY